MDATRGPTSPDSPRHSGGPARSPSRLLFRLLRYARPYLGLLALALVMTFVFAGGRYTRAYLIKPLVDDVLSPVIAGTAGPAPDTSETSPLVPDFLVPRPAPGAAERAAPHDAAARDHAVARFREIVWIALALTLVVPVAMFGRGYLLQWVLGRANVDIKQDLATKLLRIPLRRHREMSTGDALTRLLVDVDLSQRGIQLFFLDLLQALIMVTIGVGALFFISWRLAALTLVAAPPVVLVIGYFGRRVRRGARRRQEQQSEVTQRLVDILSGIKVIKAFRGEAQESAVFAREAHRYFQRVMKVVRSRLASHGLTELLTNAVAFGVLLAGTLLVWSGGFGLTTGDLSAFAATLALTYKPTKTLTQGWSQIMEALASAARFFELLDEPEEQPDAPGALPLDGVHDSIRFEHVRFSYGREPVLRDVSLEVRPGEVIAVVGPTGSGKTTLLDLLLRFYDPDEGSIRIDGRDLREIARPSLLEAIAVVTQEPFLFDGTIRENVLYGRPGASDAQYRDACRAAHVDEFVDQLPDGDATEVGEFGVRLSGGQRQRITIARAILCEAAILVFDEATSSLDAKTERTVQDAIEALRGHRTVFVIAHRLSTIRRADRIVVLERGVVTQQGSHDELVARGGLYRELVALTSEGADEAQAE